MIRDGLILGDGWIAYPVGCPPPRPKLTWVERRKQVLTWVFNRTESKPAEIPHEPTENVDPAPEVERPYKVYVDDNYHYMDADERYTLGTFEDCASAVAACKKIVDEFLDKMFAGDDTAEEIWSAYTSFGEDPWVITTGDEYPPCGFSAWTYAKDRIKEVFDER